MSGRLLLGVALVAHVFVVVICNEPLQCGPNEEENSCPSHCYTDSCPTTENQYSGCPAPGDCGPPRCKCRSNMKRAVNGTCIDTKECPPFKCDRPYEEYVACPPFCPTDDCSQSTHDGSCPIHDNMLIETECEPVCRCIKGYWRNDGKCVPYEECPVHQPSQYNFFGL